MAATAVMMTTPRSSRGGAMPFLPGFSGNEPKPHNKRNQSLTYGPGGAMDTLRSNGDMPQLDLSVLQQLADPNHRYTKSSRSMTHDEREALKESARNTYQPAIPPAWLKHDRQVLRFYAYFQEPVHENPTENFRVRHCSIQFYLEDGTMMVTEPKMENSGIPQGTFVKRHRIPKPREVGGGYYTYQDLRVGMTISIYARAFRIVDADDFTRAFYETALGEQLYAGEEPPLDSFRAAKLQESARLASPSSRDIIEGKEYNELALGGNRRNAKLQQYLENDRKVLSFKCYWDDHTRYGARQYYTLHYYLADDTVEILENLARNSGRDPYPVFWRRSPLRRNPHVSPAPGMLEPEPIIYKPEDFIVGEAIHAYGREIFVYDCDDFTRDFYRQYMGHEQDKLEIKEPDPIHVQLSYPPHTGFGTEEDSLASCLNLTPRPPRRDISKLMTDADKILRFEGRMWTNMAEDKNRRFVIGIYLADDSVGVWEMRQRNSGQAAGKFALKSRKKNTATGTWFNSKDFYVGAIIDINATTFKLIAADRGTLRYMEEHKEEYAVADAATVMAKLRLLQPVFRSEFQHRGHDLIMPDQLGAMAEAHNLPLAEHELLTLSRTFGEDPEVTTYAPVSVSRLLNAMG